MAFSIGSLGEIKKQLTSAISDAFGLGESSGDSKHKSYFKTDYFGSSTLELANWTGNAYPGAGRVENLRYGFAIMESQKTGKLSLRTAEIYYLQVAPQSIQQKEVFATSVQATRKGVTVESEGVVFKDIVISGNTGIFPGERASGTNPVPNFKDFTKPPLPAAGVDPATGKSPRSESKTYSGYEEFLSLRQFFLKYAKEKVDKRGALFFGFINEKDNQYLIVEPMEFTMERNSRSPLTYDYRIVLKAIGSIDDLGTAASKVDDAIDFLGKISNVSANISATLAASTTVINAATGSLIAITQALDDVFLTPIRQLKIAVDSINQGASTVLSLPSILVSNYKGVGKIKLEIAEKKGAISDSLRNFEKNTKTGTVQVNLDSSSVTTNSLGEVSSTGSGQLATPSLTLASPSALASQQSAPLLNSDGAFSTNLSSQQYSQIVSIINQLDNDSTTPLPRSFVENLRDNTISLRNNLADSVGLGSSFYDSINGRTITQQAPALSTPTDEQYRLLGALQDVIMAINKILANNEFFQNGAEGIYSKAQASYGAVADIRKPATVKETTINFGDTLELIALREFGDALRWVDLVVLNNLRSPYILSDVVKNPPEGVKMPGEKLLVGEN